MSARHLPKPGPHQLRPLGELLAIEIRAEAPALRCTNCGRWPATVETRLPCACDATPQRFPGDPGEGWGGVAERDIAELAGYQPRALELLLQAAAMLRAGGKPDAG